MKLKLEVLHLIDPREFGAGENSFLNLCTELLFFYYRLNTSLFIINLYIINDAMFPARAVVKEIVYKAAEISM